MTNSIYAFRDNSGQKPLYYFLIITNFFCSEINPIFQAVRAQVSINKNILDGLRFLSNLGHNTIFDKIYKILPGEKIEFNLDNKILKKEFFFSKYSINNNDNFNDILKSTINDHLQTNRKMVLNLSGGIDSNIILHESLKKITI